MGAEKPVEESNSPQKVALPREVEEATKPKLVAPPPPTPPLPLPPPATLGKTAPTLVLRHRVKRSPHAVEAAGTKRQRASSPDGAEDAGMGVGGVTAAAVAVRADEARLPTDESAVVVEDSQKTAGSVEESGSTGHPSDAEDSMKAAGAVDTVGTPPPVRSPLSYVLFPHPLPALPHPSPLSQLAAFWEGKVGGRSEGATKKQPKRANFHVNSCRTPNAQACLWTRSARWQGTSWRWN